MSDRVHVPMGTRSYDVHIAPGLIAEAGAALAPLLTRPFVAAITDANVAAAQLPSLRASLDAAGIAHEVLVLPPGETTKSWAHLQQALEWLLACRVERGDVVVALGGGVIGDLAGFAAAILRRGVRFVQIPTTLLAQVDSSVGGKTGINAASGKNLVGAFHQPSLVLADLGALDSLPARDLRSGYGEVLKYACLGDAAFFDWLETNGAAVIAGDVEARRHAVRRSVEMKAQIVAGDETETGDRKLLNLGHTFGHALEAATGYGGRLLHGEAVAIGLVLAFELSARLGHCSGDAPRRIRAHLQRIGLPSGLAQIPGELPPTEVLLTHMAQDKKVVGGRLTLIVARRIGDAFAAQDVPADAISDVLDGPIGAAP